MRKERIILTLRLNHKRDKDLWERFREVREATGWTKAQVARELLALGLQRRGGKRGGK